MIFLWSLWLLAITYLLYGQKGALAREKQWFTLAVVLTGALLLVNLLVASLPEQLIIAISTVIVAVAPIVKRTYFNISRWLVLFAAIVAYALLF